MSVRRKAMHWGKQTATWLTCERVVVEVEDLEVGEGANVGRDVTCGTDGDPVDVCTSVPPEIGREIRADYVETPLHRSRVFSVREGGGHSTLTPNSDRQKASIVLRMSLIVAK